MRGSVKIVISGGFGWHDIGDEAMPQAAITNLTSLIPGVEIVMLSPNPIYTLEYHKKRSIHDINKYLKEEVWLAKKLKSVHVFPVFLIGKAINWICSQLVYFFRCLYFVFVAELAGRGISLPIKSSAKAIIEELSSADLLFNNGGGNINSVLPNELYKQCLTMLVASALKIPIVVSGQTMGPYSNRIHKWIVRKALNNAHTITFRDKEISKNRLEEIGVKAPAMSDTADDAISLPCLTKEETKQLIIENNGQEWLDFPSPFVLVLNMNGYRLGMNKNAKDSFFVEVSLCAAIVKYFIEKLDAKILMVPTDYSSTSDDRTVLRDLKETINYDARRVLVIDQEYDAIQLKSLVGWGNFAIGSRYHFLVFATSLAIPCIGLANGVYQRTKLEGLFDLYDLGEYVIRRDMDKLSVNDVIQTVEKMLEQKEEIMRRMSRKTSILQEASALSFQSCKILCEARVG